MWIHEVLYQFNKEVSFTNSSYTVGTQRFNENKGFFVCSGLSYIHDLDHVREGSLPLSIHLQNLFVSQSVIQMLSLLGTLPNFSLEILNI